MIDVAAYKFISIIDDSRSLAWTGRGKVRGPAVLFAVGIFASDGKVRVSLLVLFLFLQT